jgi:hypothetical protein
MAIPIVALAVAATMSAGGAEAMVTSLEGAIRETFSAVATFARSLF